MYVCIYVSRYVCVCVSTAYVIVIIVLALFPFSTFPGLNHLFLITTTNTLLPVLVFLVLFFKY
jgi:hypothetical protein